MVLSGKKNLPVNTGDAGSISGLGRSPGEENGNPHQFSCLGIPMGRGAWRVRVHGVAKESDMTQQLNNNNSALTMPHTEIDKPPWSFSIYQTEKEKQTLNI